MLFNHLYQTVVAAVMLMKASATPAPFYEADGEELARREVSCALHCAV
jgi:hypothetical protein